MKIVVLDGFAAASTDLSYDFLQKYCDDLKVYDRTNKDEIVERIADAQMVITNKVVLSADILSQCKNVKYIGILATGYNNIDIEYCKNNGIVVSNAPGYSTNGVAQLVFAYIFHFYNMVSTHNYRVHNGEWENCKDFAFFDNNISELSGKTIGIIGYGSIGKKVAAIAKTLDMNVLAYSRSYKDCDIDTLFLKSDIITMHCPLFPETKNLVNKDSLSKMKKSAILINTARGPVVNEQDLADALNSQQIRGAAVDVVSAEPIKKDNPLLKAKNCIITPHLGWADKESRERLMKIVEENVSSFINGKPINNVAK